MDQEWLSGVTVVIPTCPGRTAMLHRAFASVEDQIYQPEAVVIVPDHRKTGAPATRTQGLEMVRTEWTAFLDDDDVLYPTHLQALKRHAETTGADLIFPWYDVKGGTDPFPENEGRQFDVEHPHQTTVTFLVKTELALTVGGFVDPGAIDPELDPGLDPAGHRAGEEYRFVIRFAQAGYKVEHLNQRTWEWHHHGKNSMGLPSRVYTPGKPLFNATR